MQVYLWQQRGAGFESTSVLPLCQSICTCPHPPNAPLSKWPTYPHWAGMMDRMERRTLGANWLLVLKENPASVSPRLSQTGSDQVRRHKGAWLQTPEQRTLCCCLWKAGRFLQDRTRRNCRERWRKLKLLPSRSYLWWSDLQKLAPLGPCSPRHSSRFPLG